MKFPSPMFVFLGILLSGMGCIDFPVPAPMGASCSKSSDCNTEFCHGGLCLSLTGDDDGDKLTNFDEQLLGTNPVLSDSDGDQLTDNQEIGDPSLEPNDRDNDGINDALEHNTEDEDNDCLPDWADPRNAVPDASQKELVDYHCATSGLCADSKDQIVVTCVDRVATCHYDGVPGYSSTGETACDGLDEDCDGLVDNGMMDEGIPGDFCSGIGACGSGVIECSSDGSKAICSTSPEGSNTGAIPELCDGFDNDCDGFVDEGFLLGDLEVGSSCTAQGACGSGVGVVQCVQELNAPLCLAATGPIHWVGPEVCDDIDTDCDGSTDEGVVAITLDGEERAVGEPCGSGVCSGGLVVCSAAKTPICSSEYRSKPETCDWIDNDCDGEIDNGMTFLGQELGGACSALGECGGGIVECAQATQVPVCSSGPGGSSSQANKEVCDGLDNDCNGLVDDGLGIAEEGNSSCWSPGVCGEGVLICSANGNVVCSTEPGQAGSPGGTEICNGLDDDCDGLTDEELLENLDTDWLERGFLEHVGSGALVRGVSTASQLYYAEVGGSPPAHHGWKKDLETGVETALPGRLGTTGAPAALFWDPTGQRLLALDNGLNEEWGRIDSLDLNGTAWAHWNTSLLSITGISCTALLKAGLLLIAPEGGWLIPLNGGDWTSVTGPGNLALGEVSSCSASPLGNTLILSQPAEDGGNESFQCDLVNETITNCSNPVYNPQGAEDWYDGHNNESMVLTSGENQLIVWQEESTLPVPFIPKGTPRKAWWIPENGSGMVITATSDQWTLYELKRLCP